MNITQAVEHLVTLIRDQEREQARKEIIQSLSNGHRPNGFVARPRPARAGGERVRSPRRRKGEKRPPAAIAAVTARLGAAIKAKPGLRIEQLGKALATPTKDLKLPVERLFATKQIKSRGEKRATRYYPKAS